MPKLGLIPLVNRACTGGTHPAPPNRSAVPDRFRPLIADALYRLADSTQCGDSGGLPDQEPERVGP
jgi:hypothetical protein